ncbi:putative phage holin [Streptomyces misionensis]|uniref:putative phage holin n=1 Tax=Streptomyces misionensis TaxID=67331 RepID=UPI00396C0095
MDCSQLANLTASALVTLTCLIFAVVYHLYAPWRSTAVGRHLMAFTLTLGALTAYTVATTLWPTGDPAVALRWTRILVLVLIAALVMQRTRMVVRAQHRREVLPDAERDKHPTV